MRIDGKFIYADEGNLLRRIEDQKVIGEYYCIGYLYWMNGQKLDTPKLELPEHFEEINKEEYEAQIRAENERRYPLLVDELIRQKYTLSAELAILRQRNTKPEEFEEYNEYCEYCKQIAKQSLNL